MDTEAAFTADEISQGEDYPTLGPAYFAARDIAEKFMAPFEAEHFKPLIEKFADDFRHKLWDDLQTYLLMDVESNLGGSLWRMVDGTINALLTGDQWALDRYVMAATRYGEAPKVRAAILKHAGGHLVTARIAELEARVAELQADNQRLRGF